MKSFINHQLNMCSVFIKCLVERKMSVQTLTIKTAEIGRERALLFVSVDLQIL